ncbi:MAG: ribulose-phosphate 3-epimerase [Deltaproteobacteria bacterium]|nr:ribulose-phosphate 3-epimerase [Deltaproteobacteria bacterium]
MNKKRKISPSILSADFSALGAAVRQVEEGGADWIHVDVMDGHFVPNITIGPLVVKAVRKVTKLPLDVHLMIEKPERYIDVFAAAGSDYLTVQAEACVHLHRVLQSIRQAGMKAGVALNPHTPLCAIEEVLGDLDLILIMSVNPGFGGQQFIPASLDKLKRLRALLGERGLTHIDIEVDGGVKLDNARKIADAGAEVLVAGSAIFDTPDPSFAVQEMKKVLA